MISSINRSMVGSSTSSPQTPLSTSPNKMGSHHYHHQHSNNRLSGGSPIMRPSSVVGRNTNTGMMFSRRTMASDAEDEIVGGK